MAVTFWLQFPLTSFLVGNALNLLIYWQAVSKLGSQVRACNPVRSEKEGTENLVEEIVAENFPDLGKETDILLSSLKHREL